MCNHELSVIPPKRRKTDAVAGEPAASPRGRRIDDDQSGTRPGGAEMRLARLPTEAGLDTAAARQSQHAVGRDACATAVAHERERIAEGLYDTVMHRLFAAGLQLQATCQVVDASAQARIETTIELLDATITELRKAIFSLQ